MKYDSSMKMYNPDILRNLYAMCSEDKSVAKLAKEASPVPLREYLKKTYGKPYRSHAGNGVHYSCTPTNGVDIVFNISLNNDKDKQLTLSWSQTANFIRKRIEEGKWKEPLENQPSPAAEDPASYTPPQI